MDQRNCFEWRVICDGRHASPEHISLHANQAAAMDSLEHFSQAEFEFTRKYCLPARIEYRYIGDWKRP